MAVDQEEFFRLGLQLSEEDSRRLKKVLNLACLGLAVAAGVGLAEVGVKGLYRPLSPAPSKNMQLVMLLAGLGVGMVAVGATCSVMKLKIERYIASHSDTHTAIAALTPSTRKQLREDARRLLSIEQKIETMGIEDQWQNNPYAT